MNTQPRESDYNKLDAQPRQSDYNKVDTIQPPSAR